MKKSRPIEHQVCAQVGAAILKVGKMEGIKDFFMREAHAWKGWKWRIGLGFVLSLRAVMAYGSEKRGGKRKVLVRALFPCTRRRKG